jgi:hypothetical protein
LEWNDDEMTMTSCQGLVTRWLEDRLRSDDDDHHVNGLSQGGCQDIMPS